MLKFIVEYTQSITIKKQLFSSSSNNEQIIHKMSLGEMRICA